MLEKYVIVVEKFLIANVVEIIYTYRTLQVFTSVCLPYSKLSDAKLVLSPSQLMDVRLTM